MWRSDVGRDFSCDNIADIKLREKEREARGFERIHYKTLPTPGRHHRAPCTPRVSPAQKHANDARGNKKTPVISHVVGPDLVRTLSRRSSLRNTSPDDKTVSCFSASLPRVCGGPSGSSSSSSYSAASSSCPGGGTSGSCARPASLEVLSHAADELAAAITSCDQLVFRQIQPDELACIGWNSRRKHQLSPNVVALTRRFNQVSFWTVKEILSVGNVKQRSEVLGQFIRVAKRLQELNNLHAQFAIVSALQTTPVYRLQKTWALLPKNLVHKFDKQRELFHDVNNWEKLREFLSRVKLPCIPYLGLYLTDLVYVDMAHPQSGGLESSQRRNQMNNILRTISEFQQSDYSHLAHNARVTAYLASVRYIDELQKFVDDDNYKLSLQLEPASNNSSSSPSASTRTSSVPTTGGGARLSLPARAQQAQGGTATAPHSPSKQSRNSGHRRAASLGVKARSLSLPRYISSRSFSSTCSGATIARTSGGGQRVLLPGYDSSSTASSSSGASNSGAATYIDRQPRHLLDDSILNPSGACRPGYDVGTDCEPAAVEDEEATDSLPMLRSVDGLQNWWTVDAGSVCSIQGCLRRKTLLKAGRRPHVATWQRYWVQLWTSSLVYFAGKKLKCNDRSDFRTDPCKMHSVLHWSVHADNISCHRDTLILHNPASGDMYKFRVGSEAQAEEWLKHLHNASLGSHTQSPPANLITFE